ncbi:helix-turn-helix domain-containing protein, partial [Streptomyces sp. NPDC087300]
SIRLRDTDEPVESISDAVGYGSPHAFSRAFRRARGTAPGEYRSRLRR